MGTRRLNLLIAGVSLALGVQMFGGAARAEVAPPSGPSTDDLVINAVSSLPINSSLPITSLNTPSRSLTDSLELDPTKVDNPQQPLVLIGTVGAGSVREADRPGDLTPCLSSEIAIPNDTVRWFLQTPQLCEDFNALEDDAVAAVIRTYGLRDDATYARAVARSEIRAEIMSRLLGAAVKEPYRDGVAADATHRSAAEQRMIAWFEGVEQKFRIGSARAALAEFEKFAKDGGTGSCTYTPPAPHQSEYPTQGGRWFGCFTRNPLSSFFNLGPNYPDQSQWTTWGLAAATADLPTARAAVIGAGLSTSVLAGLAVGGTYAAAQIGWQVLFQLAKPAAAELAKAIVPFAVRTAFEAAGVLAAEEFTSKGLAVAGKALGGLVGPVAVIVGIALTLAIATGEYVTKGPKVREELTKAIAAADVPVDLRTALSDTAQDESSIFNFLATNWMALQYDDDPALPAALTRNYDDGVLTVDGVRTDSFSAVGWDGKVRTVQLRGGYFVVDGIPRVSLTYLDAAGEKRTAYRMRISAPGATPRFAFAAMKSDDTSATCSVGADGAISGSCAVLQTLDVRRAPLGSADSSTFSLGWAPNTAPVPGIAGTATQSTGIAVLNLDSVTDAEGDAVTTTWEIERRPYGRRDLTDPCTASSARDTLPAGSCWETVSRSLKASTPLPTSGSYRWRLTIDDGVGKQVRTGTVNLANRRPQVRRGAACGTAGAEPAACTINQAYGGQPISYGVAFVEPDASDPTDVTLTWSDGVVWNTSYRDVCTAADPTRCNGTTFADGAATWTTSGSVRYLKVDRTFPDFAGPSVTMSATDGASTVTDQQAFSIRPARVVPPPPPVITPADYLALTKVSAGKELPFVRQAATTEPAVEPVATGNRVQVRGFVDQKSGTAPITVTVDWADGTPAQTVTLPCSGACPAGVETATTVGGRAFGLTRVFSDPRTAAATVTVSTATQGPFTGTADYQVVRPPLAVAGLFAGAPLDSIADFSLTGGGTSSIDEGKALEVRGAVEGVASGDQVALDVDWGDRVDTYELPCTDCGITSTYVNGRRIFTVQRFFGRPVAGGVVGVQVALLGDGDTPVRVGERATAGYQVLDTPSAYPDEYRFPQCGDVPCPLVENKRVRVTSTFYDWGFTDDLEVLIKGADGPGSVQVVPATVQPGYDPGNPDAGQPGFDFAFDVVPRIDPRGPLNFPFTNQDAMNFQISFRRARGADDLTGVDTLFDPATRPRQYLRLAVPVNKLTGAAPTVSSFHLTPPPGQGRTSLPVDSSGRVVVKDGVLGVGAALAASGEGINLAAAQVWIDQPADTPPNQVTGPIALQGAVGQASGVAAGLLDVSLLTEGEHTITLAARDEADRLTTVTRTFVVDRTAPVITPPAADAAGSPGARPALDQFVDDAEAATFGFVPPTAAEPDGAAVPVDCGDTTPALEEPATFVACTATDTAGNEARYGFTVQVAGPAPQNLRASTGPGKVTVAWSPPATGADAVTGYLVQRVGDAGAATTVCRRSPTQTLRCTASGLVDGQPYLFRVVALTGTRVSRPATVAATPLRWVRIASQPAAAVTVAPGEPLTLTTTVTGSPAPTLRWERSTDGGRTWSPRGEATVGLTATLVEPAGVPRTGWRYRLKITQVVSGTRYGRTVTVTVQP